jgi:sec-independent protein translocase protein TatB
VNFLNVGPWELTVILIIAILLVGPKRVVEIVQAIRRFAGQLGSMSSEFTSLIQAEVQASEREASSQDEPQDARREADGKLGEIVKDSIAPIASMQAELRDSAQKTRQALERIVQDDVGPIAGMQAELRDTAQETRQALESPTQETTAKSEPESKEAQDEAPDKGLTG